MLKELKEAFGFRPIFILDGSVAQCAKTNILRGMSEDGLSLQELVEGNMTRAAEILYLLNNTRTMVISEVREEFREFLSHLRASLNRNDEYMRVLRDANYRRDVLPQLQEYAEILEVVKKTMQNKDPREKSFQYEDVFRVDRNKELYRKTFELAMRFPNRKRNGEESKHPTTDAHLITLAHVYETRGYEACILTDDMGISKLARNLKRETVMRNIGEAGRVVFIPRNSYTIRLFSPMFLNESPERNQSEAKSYS